MVERINLHVYQSCFLHESRMLRITKSLVDNRVFDKIYILARWKSGLPDKEQLDASREVWRLRTRFVPRFFRGISKLLTVLEWFARVAWAVRRLPVSCINCHSLVVLPLCVALSRLKSCRLVYDTHELETETASARGLRKWIGKAVERWLIRYADVVVVVGDRIAEWYRNEYGLGNVDVVRNLPYGDAPRGGCTTLLRDAFELQRSDILFLYQGLIDSGRAIELLLNVFSRASKGKHLVLMGYGPLVDLVREYEQRHSNIHFHPAVPPNEIGAHCSSADVGLSIIENVSLSYYYCLPNKIFEYLNCGVPMIVSDFPEMSSLVDREGCGWKVAVSEDNVSRLIDSLTTEEIEAKRVLACRKRSQFRWEQEERRMVRLYQDFGSPVQQAGRAA